jgi:hypothetical protein
VCVVRCPSQLFRRGVCVRRGVGRPMAGCANAKLQWISSVETGQWMVGVGVAGGGGWVGSGCIGRDVCRPSILVHSHIHTTHHPPHIPSIYSSHPPSGCIIHSPTCPLARIAAIPIPHPTSNCQQFQPPSYCPSITCPHPTPSAAQTPKRGIVPGNSRVKYTKQQPS